MNNPPNETNTAQILNTIVDAMGAMVMCMARQLTPEQRRAMANDMARLSANASATGNTPLGSLLSDLARAANN